MSAPQSRSPTIPAAATGRAALPDPKWGRNAARRFHRLVKLESTATGLAGRSGVFVAWHAGVQPRWVYVGRTPDLARAMRDLVHNAEVAAFEARGGVFVTWSFVSDEFQDGVVLFLTDLLEPLVANRRVRRKGVTPMPVQPPASSARRRRHE
ncbi:MAG: hypothetical protein QGG17_04005 [Rhodospirillales bacterium]|jgi:hypothetical protein|nr:hypothetical protein [Rhodospirillales bacterium]MDP6804056.1 hypothetical protein [Rhodospirillales bacterium]